VLHKTHSATLDLLRHMTVSLSLRMRRQQIVLDCITASLSFAAAHHNFGRCTKHMGVCCLKSVHTSNNVEATLSNGASTQSNVASTSSLADPRGAGRGHGPPRHVGKRPECTKRRHFQTPQTPASFPLHKSQRSFQHACFVA